MRKETLGGSRNAQPSMSADEFGRVELKPLG